MSGHAHTPYWNAVLKDEFCHGDGEPWPCLAHRQSAPPRCQCSHGASTHTGGYGKCWFSVCCCETYRDPNEEAGAIPARLDERYDPSPEPIDRSIQ